MTVTPAPRTSDPNPPSGVAPVSWRRMLAREWRGMWSAPAARVLVGAAAAVVIIAGLAASAALAGTMAAGSWDADGGGRFLPLDPTAATLIGVAPAQLLLGVLGVLAARRQPDPAGMLWARAVACGGTVLLLMAAACLVAFLGGRTFFAAAGIEVAFSDGPSGSPAVLRAVALAAPFYLAGVAVLGVVVGTLVRLRAVAVVLLLAVTAALAPALTALLPEPELVVPYLPGAAGEAFRSVAPRPDLLAPWRGFALLSAYLVGAVAGTSWVLRRRRT